MNESESYRSDRNGMAAHAGLVAAALVAAIAAVPLEWFIASLILAVLAMPAVLIVGPAIQRLRETSDLPPS